MNENNIVSELKDVIKYIDSRIDYGEIYLDMSIKEDRLIKELFNIIKNTYLIM